MEAVADKALQAGGLIANFDGNVSILLTDNSAMKTLNRDFRAKDYPTDVLSFPADPRERPFLGDIAIAYGVTKTDAENQSKDFEDHVSHLLIHGLLHLAGYDHENDESAMVMEELERKALASLGIADPYSTAEYDS